jgi:hypothetical protein
VRRNPERVRYVEVERDSTASLEEDAVLIGVSVLIVVGLGYLLYQKSQEAANAVVEAIVGANQSAQQSLGNALSQAANALPTPPGAGVPYTPPEGGLDPDTYGGYP